MHEALNPTRDIPRAWPFEEAQRLHRQRQGQSRKPAIFETGYGPSGLPHIGTFGEVVRTQMVRHAYEQLTGEATRLIVFSDDMDGLRKIPDNIENHAVLESHLHKPLTAIPDPFGTHASFGDHNNSKLCEFLDRFGFDYEFLSATKCYQQGMFDQALLRMISVYDEVMQIMLPGLGEARRKTYSPFLPICPETGRVLYVPVIATDVQAGTIIYQREDGKKIETPVTGGACKLQWKPDWGMRWYALQVDYEMCGKDLIESRILSGRICRTLGQGEPAGLIYEHFLDRGGEKISKSKGNGLSIETWLDCAPIESLALYMYQRPKSAKRLYPEVIPKSVDEYLAHLRAFPSQESMRQMVNPVWHIHQGKPPIIDGDLNYSLLLNLAMVMPSADPATLRGFLQRYRKEDARAEEGFFDGLVDHALAYAENFAQKAETVPEADADERAALLDLSKQLGRFQPPGDGTNLAKALQDLVLEVGKAHGFSDLRSWFRLLYRQLFGREEGPRIGSFIALYGTRETIALLRQALRLRL